MISKKALRASRRARRQGAGYSMLAIMRAGELAAYREDAKCPYPAGSEDAEIWQESYDEQLALLNRG